MHIYPNEILISAVSRRAQIVGVNHLRPTNRHLFGVDHKKMSIDLPSSIGALLENGIFKSTPQELIKEHTLFPFFQPFLNEEQGKKVMASMIGHGGKSVHLTSGIMASVVRRYPYLKLCPHCLLENIQTYGEPYWHVDHQIPGMMVCAKHNCTLISHCKVCGTELTGVCPTFCSYGHELISQVDYCGSTILGFLSNELTKEFNLCKSGQLQSDNFQHLYHLRLKQLGYCSERGRVNQAEFSKKFIELFPERILHIIGVPSPSGGDTWLASMLRRKGRSFHPLLHVLVILSLWGEMENFYETYRTSEHPIPCMTFNRASNSTTRKTTVTVPRTNWRKRDKQIASEINHALLELRSRNGKPFRITIARVGKHIRKLGLLERHLDKLPLCRCLLERNLDSIEQYQVNKIDWAISTVIKEGKEVTRWRVLRKAGIRVLATENVDVYLNHKINEIVTIRMVA